MRNSRARSETRCGWLSSISRRFLAASLAASVGLAGCSTSDGGGPDSSGEPEFGLGGKADQVCSPEADLCWDSDDSSLMRELLMAQDEIVLGQEPQQALRRTVELTRAIEHKLNDDERAALDDIAGNVEAMDQKPPAEDAVDVLIELQDRTLKRTVGAYYVAHMVPVGQAIDGDGKFDEDDANNGAPGDGESVAGISEGMSESLRLLRDSGAIGIAIAEMYKMTGVLERDYQMVNAVNFGELDPVTGKIIPTGLSREARVQQIISKYRRAAGFVGAGAGVVGLVPIAGIALSVSGETIALFKLHAQMSFEIAAVYGWNLKDGTNLYLMSTMFMTDGLLTEVADVLASNLLVPLLAKKAAQKLGVELSVNLAKQVSQRSIKQLLQFFSRKAQQELAEQAVKGAAKGIAGQLLGWATLGLTVFASAAIDWVLTDRLGRHVQVVSKRWLHDLLMEGTTYLSAPQKRDCAFRGLAAVAWEDGEVNDREKAIYMAFLAKPYAADEATWFHLDSNEKVRQARVLRDWQDNDSVGDVKSCLEAQFVDSLAQHRMSLLGHLYAMMEVDTDETASEFELYHSYRDGLDGSGWFDGDAIDDEQMDYIQRAIFVTVNPNVVEASGELGEATNAMLVEDVLEFIATPDPDTHSDFECGFAGSC